MNRKNREAITVTLEEVEKCFKTEKLAEAKERLLSDDFVKMSKEVTYNRIYEVARKAIAKYGSGVRMPNEQFCDEVFHDNLLQAALQTGTSECIKSGDLSSLEQKVADSLTRELAAEILEQMLDNVKLSVEALSLNNILDQFVEKTVEGLFTDSEEGLNEK